MNEILALLKTQQNLLSSLSAKVTRLEFDMKLIREHYQSLNSVFLTVQKKLSRCPPTCPHLYGDMGATETTPIISDVNIKETK